MDYYFDITILPDPEIETAHLLNTLFGKLHIVLAKDANAFSVGVSFPQAPAGKLSLGTVLRLHGPKANLQNVKDIGWLGGAHGYLKVSEVTATPIGAKHCAVRRVQAKSNAARLRRRLMRRQNIDEVEALKRIPDAIEQRLDLPWVQMRSASSGQSFRFFIKQYVTEPATGSFNAYGLSDSGTVPWF